jgi:hypothetical protein
MNEWEITTFSFSLQQQFALLLLYKDKKNSVRWKITTYSQCVDDE